MGFSRANLFGKHFEAYRKEAQAPLLVAMIEHTRAVDNLEEIILVEGLDAILIGPYDLSASMGLTGRFEHPTFKKTMERIRSICRKNKVPSGIHIINPDLQDINKRIQEGYQFIAFSTDAIFLRTLALRQKPKKKIIS